MADLILNLQNTPENREWFKGRVAYDSQMEETRDGTKLIVRLYRNFASTPTTMTRFMFDLKKLDFVGIAKGMVIGSPDLVNFVETGLADIWLDKWLTARAVDLIA